MRQMNLQDVFLNQVRKEKIPVTIYLTNGFQFKGIVQGFDSFTIVLNSEERQNLVYKHAVSSILPSRAIHLALPEGQGKNGDELTGEKAEKE